MILISCLLTVIPIITVLLIKKIPTPNKITIKAIDTYPKSFENLLNVSFACSECLTFLTPSTFEILFTKASCSSMFFRKTVYDAESANGLSFANAFANSGSSAK